MGSAVGIKMFTDYGSPADILKLICEVLLLAKGIIKGLVLISVTVIIVAIVLIVVGIFLIAPLI